MILVENVDQTPSTTGGLGEKEKEDLIIRDAAGWLAGHAGQFGQPPIGIGAMPFPPATKLLIDHQHRIITQPLEQVLHVAKEEVLLGGAFYLQAVVRVHEEES